MKIKRLFGKFRKEIKLYYHLFRDKRTPRISKIMIIIAVVYLIWPFDLIPDFIPFAGWVDEIIIIPTLFYLATLFVPKYILDEHKEKTFKKEFEHIQEGEIIN